MLKKATSNKLKLLKVVEFVSDFSVCLELPKVPDCWVVSIRLWLPWFMLHEVVLIFRLLRLLLRFGWVVLFVLTCWPVLGCFGCVVGLAELWFSLVFRCVFFFCEGGGEGEGRERDVKLNNKIVSVRCNWFWIVQCRFWLLRVVA